MLSDSKLDSILDELEAGLKSMMGYESQEDAMLADDATKEFISNQYDVKLSNLIEAAGSDIHHLESGVKNKIILRKQKFIDSL